MSLFSSFFNSIHAEAKTWMQNYIRRYNVAQTRRLREIHVQLKDIQAILRRKNRRQWSTFNKYYAFVKTITFLVLFVLICLTMYGYYTWGIEIRNYPKYWLSFYVYGILSSLLLQLFGMFFALFDFTSRLVTVLYKTYDKIKSTFLNLWYD